MSGKKMVKLVIMKGLPIVGALAVGVGATMVLVNKDKLEDRVTNKLIARQIIKENIPLQ